MIGPINGNIHYPEALRNREPMTYRVSVLPHPIFRLVNRIGFSGRRQLMFCWCWRRACSSITADGGMSAKQFVETVDTGILDRLNEARGSLTPGATFASWTMAAWSCTKAPILSSRA